MLCFDIASTVLLVVWLHGPCSPRASLRDWTAYLHSMPAIARCRVQAWAKLVDEIVPSVPNRQWVLLFPIPLRLVFAQRAEVLSAVLGVVARALSGDVIRRAGQRPRGAQTGVVTFIQRFGSALNLNLHLHMLVSAPARASHQIPRGVGPRCTCSRTTGDETACVRTQCR